MNVLKAPGASRVGKGDVPGGNTTQNRFAEQGITSLAQLRDACIDFSAIERLYFDSIGENGLLEPVIYSDDTGEYEIGEAMAITSSRRFGEFGSTTGKPRITGLFDCVMGAQLARVQGPHGVLTCMDRGDDCERVGIVVGYIVHLPTEEEFERDESGAFVDCNGHKYRNREIVRPGDAVPNNAVLGHCVPIIRAMGGWKDTPIKGLTEGDDVPEAVCDLVAAIEMYTGLRFAALGIGPGTEDIVYLKRDAA